MRVLVVDDDASITRSLAVQLKAAGHEVRVAGDAAEARAITDRDDLDVAYIDVRLPDATGLEVLTHLLQRRPDCRAVMITGEQDMQTVIEATRRGAFDYIRKPLDLDAIEHALERVAEIHRAVERDVRVVGHVESIKPYEIVGADRSVIAMLQAIGALSQTRVPVLIQGESGSGKELVARALHHAGCGEMPFVAVNCSAVVPTLLESELFGHVKGAFTGADADKPGRLELAGAGSVFLDEIGDLPLEMQAKLLRALQEKSFERVGSAKPIDLRARVIAATNRDLMDMIRQGHFREDLYYRLAVSTLRAPPLRERCGDIPLLVDYLLADLGGETHKRVEAVERGALRRLQNHDWPGNIRELRNVLTRALLRTAGPTLTDEDVARAMDIAPSAGNSATGEQPIKTLREMERLHILEALRQLDWNITHTAKALAVSPTTLRKKIEDYDLRR